MNYQTFPSSPELAGLVSCYWTLEGAASNPPVPQTIVPDGCMEMIFHHGDLYRQYLPDGSSILQPRCFVFGQLTRPLVIEPTGVTNIFSVRFHPEGFSPWLTCPVRELENRAVSLEELYGITGQQLEQHLLGSYTVAGRIAIVENFLLQRLRHSSTVDNIVAAAVDTLLAADGQLAMKDICTPLPIDRRQLQRRFSSVVGLSPKQLARIIRLQSALRRLLEGRFASLTELAYEGEYYDQAHFIREFREFTGYTPREFYGDNLALSALFYGNDTA